MFPTKTDGFKASRAAITRAVHSALEIRLERDAGYPRTKDEMTFLQFELLLRVEANVMKQEINIKRETNEILMVAFNLKQRS
jgi:hypothetical protein